ncbi:MAG: hypothetical protein VKK62_07805 [Synechococcaceae cyanobacterium]|nr:hypothetical protein [Synechococcaceae cyanobacterium]
MVVPGRPSVPRRVVPPSLALTLLAVLPAVPARAADWPALVALFSQRGFSVVTDHPRCREPGLFGLYARNRREIIVCPRGDRRETLLHEGWHGIQSLCLRGAGLLPEAMLSTALTPADRRDLDRLYGPSGWRREAEARVMARLPLPLYRHWVAAACGDAGEEDPDQSSSGGPGSLRPDSGSSSGASG